MIVNCTSSCWADIGTALGTLHQLHTLTLLNCEMDYICLGLASSRSLKSLFMSNSLWGNKQCGNSDDELEHIAKMTQL